MKKITLTSKLHLKKESLTKLQATQINGGDPIKLFSWWPVTGCMAITRGGLKRNTRGCDSIYDCL